MREDPSFSIESLKFSGKGGVVSNVMLGAARTISASKGTVVGTVAVSNGFDTMSVGAAEGARIFAGVAADANPSNTPARAGFQTLKAASMTDTTVAGRDAQKGDKAIAPHIKVKTAFGSVFYHTDTNGMIRAEPITGQ